jgi:hypothetical protein
MDHPLRARTRTRTRSLLLVVVFATLPAGCDSDRRSVSTQTFPLAAKSACQTGDHPETALQGQVPPTMRRPGSFGGFNCNLRMVGQLRGEGAGWQHAFFTDTAGHACSYFDTAPAVNGRTHRGVVVVDTTDPAAPHAAGYLATPAMVDPRETLKVNARRGLLMAVESVGSGKPPRVDIYDIKTDCRSPRLLSAPESGSAALEKGTERADEGDFSPDGLTYYATSLRSGTVYPIDIADPQHPIVLAKWSMPANQRTSGLAIDHDGNRAYFTLYGEGAASPNVQVVGGATNGLVVADVSEVQARKPHPQVKTLGALVWGDGSASHQLIPVAIAGRPYVIATDEGGSGDSNASGWKAACAAGLPAWSMARIVDVSDEAHPRVVSELKLEVNDAGNCDQVLPDLAGLSGFTYGSHYCSVDDASNAALLACGYFESGIRLFDIRDATQPREIGYFVPPSITTPSPGSLNNATAAKGRPDHCSAQTRFDRTASVLVTTCQDNGLLVLRWKTGILAPTSSTTQPARPH